MSTRRAADGDPGEEHHVLRTVLAHQLTRRARVAGRPTQRRRGDEAEHGPDPHQHVCCLQRPASLAQTISEQAIATQPACVGPIRYGPEHVRRGIDNPKAALKGVSDPEAFIPVVAPVSIEPGT